jgi:tetratricopeptide (TPR) repeat protein
VAINKNKINDNALKFVQKGQVKKAIREYDKILAEDPGDVRTLLKKGDLLVRAGDREQAIGTYQKVANTYSKQGFHLKAVAVFKQILKIDENLIEVNLQLAEEYQHLGIIGDAMANLQKVAAYHEQMGNTQETTGVIQRMVDLDPDNIASRIKLAELYSQENMTEQAIIEFTKAADDLKGANRIEDYVKVCERLVYHDSENIDLIKELANIYLQRGETKRALGKLQLCFKMTPQDLETLNMLATAFHDLNQLPKTVSVYKEMAKIYQDQGSRAEMEQVYRRVLEIVPDDPDARQALSVGQPPPQQPQYDDYEPTMAVPIPEVGAVEEATNTARTDSLGVAIPIDEGPDSGTVDSAVIEIQPEPSPEEDEVEIIPAAEPAVEATVVQQQPMTEGAVREELSRLLTETEVYIKYGLQNKAIEHLKRVFQIDPNNIGGHEKLKAVYLLAKQPLQAAKELLILSNLMVAKGLQDKAIEYLDELLEVYPGHPDGTVLREQLTGGSPAAAMPAIDVIDEDVEMFGEDQMVEVGMNEFNDAMDVALDIDSDDILVEDTNVDGYGDATSVADASMLEAVAAEYEASNTDQAADAGISEDEIGFDVEEDFLVSDVDVELHDSQPPDEEIELIDFGSDVEDDEFFAEQDNLIDIESSPGEVEEAAFETPEEVEPVESVDDADVEVIGEGDLLLEDSSMEDLEYEDQTSEVFLDEESIEPRIEDHVDAEIESETNEDLEDALEEVDFYLQQNLLDEALDELEGMKEDYPDSDLINERIEKIKRMQQGDSSVPKIAPEEMDGPFDLAAEIEREVGEESDSLFDDDFQYSVDDVFSEFKKGVEKVVDKEDSATHYDLGIAYKEMGLMDDAVSEFAVAGQDPARKTAALSMMGLCLIEQEKYSQAIERLKDALHGPDISEQESTSIYYEMGRAYELLDDKAEAMFYFTKVHKRDKSFRDVAEKITALTNSGVVPRKDDLGDKKKPKDPKSNKSKISYM